MSLRILIRGKLDIDRIPIRKFPIPNPVTKPISNPITKPITKPTFCRYVDCKHPEICKDSNMCYVDWEPELIKY